MQRDTSSNVSTLVAGLLSLWLAMVVFAAYIGVFGAGTKYSMSVPLPLGLAVLIPVLAFIFWYKSSSSFRQYALSLNPALLATLHVERVGGIVFLIMMSKQLLPASFALPAGIGDIAIGLTAPLVAWQLSRQKRFTRAVVLWQILGIADLIIAVTTGVLSSNSKIGILFHGGADTALMGQLPMSLVPTFLVPIFVILHLISLAQARSQQSPVKYTYLTADVV